MRQKTTIILFLFTFISAFAQEKSFKEQSIEQFKNENYPLAIHLMEQALQENPKDAEVYYYLGFFNHYNAYDSRPLKGYNSNYSDKILKYLDKALELNPNYGDAKYFYMAECSAAAIKAYQKDSLHEVKKYFEKAFAKGIVPEWGIELGKNMLNACEKNAILFTHGDFALNMCLFTQLHFEYRKDISIIPLALLDRPSFDLVLSKNKDSEFLRGVDLGLTKEQILDLHPYKWDTTTVSIPITPTLTKQFSVPSNFTMDWVIKPDYYTERTVSRIEGAKIKKQAYLSPIKAMLLNVVETNKWNRPIYFTNTFEPFFLAGLDEYFQECGLVSILTPIKTQNTPYQVNVPTLENLVLNTKLDKLKTIINNDFPRVSGIIGLYGDTYLALANYYKSEGKQEKIAEIIKNYKQILQIGFDLENEIQTLSKLEEMNK
ncbi:MAG: hypothetical protein IPO21_20280 [Bacteroidales bacterium]|nr:hypothetical protein [Bacteroidales bacterium]